MKKLKELEHGFNSITLMVTEIEEKTTQRGSTFVKMTLTDGTEKIVAMMWNTTKADVEQRIKKTPIVDTQLYVGTYNGSDSYEMRQFTPNPTQSVRDFIISAPLDPEAMYNEILSTVKKSAKPLSPAGYTPVTELTRNLYEGNKTKILFWSAAKSIHHSFYGGFLYHTLRMVRSAKALCAVYPSVDAELLICGTALHDIGKLQELETSPLGTANYTVSGTLLGHLYLGMEMVEKESEKGHYDPEKVLSLKHLIASHHGTREFGAIAIPAMLEAMLLHELDMIDSRAMQFEDTVRNMKSGTLSEKRVLGLNNVQVYKP